MDGKRDDCRSKEDKGDHLDLGRSRSGAQLEGSVCPLGGVYEWGDGAEGMGGGR